MTIQQIKIAKWMLDYLHELDGGQASDIRIHAVVNEAAGEYVPRTALDEVLELADRDGWIITVKTKFKGTLRSLSPLGAATRLEMR